MDKLLNRAGRLESQLWISTRISKKKIFIGNFLNMGIFEKMRCEVARNENHTHIIVFYGTRQLFKFKQLAFILQINYT